MKGIYCYIDKKDDKIVYIGKDSNINVNARHRQHNKPSEYSRQQINKVIQNHPNRYKYLILKQGDFKEPLLNALEILYIRRYTPLFNFTVGGEGSTGRTLSKESREKLSKAKTGIKIHTPESRQRLSELKKGTIPWNKGKKMWGTKPHPRLNTKHTDETKKKISDNHADVSGKNNPRYRDDIPDASSLLKEYENGISYYRLGKKYNCSKSTIRNRILKHKKELNDI